MPDTIETVTSDEPFAHARSMTIPELIAEYHRVNSMALDADEVRDELWFAAQRDFPPVPLAITDRIPGVVKTIPVTRDSIERFFQASRLPPRDAERARGERLRLLDEYEQACEPILAAHGWHEASARCETLDAEVDELIDRIEAESATCLADIAAKLRFIGEWDDNLDLDRDVNPDYIAPKLFRSVLADLDRLAGASTGAGSATRVSATPVDLLGRPR
jgi:hypothetical protein